MSDGFHLLDIVFFAMVAAFLVLRLRSVLGRRTGEERPPPESPAARRPGAPVTGTVIDLASQRKPAAEPPPTGPAAGGLLAIRAAEPSFSHLAFLDGARGAFTMIVAAFAAGDTATLKPLLSPEVFGQFAAAIQARVQAGHRLETELVRIRSAEAIEAKLEGTAASITVRFASEQVNVMRDSEGRVLEGEPGRVAELVDEWTFRRDLRSPDPNWELVATRLPEA